MKLSPIIAMLISVLLPYDTTIAKQLPVNRNDLLGCWYSRGKQSEELQDVQSLIRNESDNTIESKFLVMFFDGKMSEQQESGTWSLNENVYTIITAKLNGNPIDAAESNFHDDYLIERMSSNEISFQHLKSGRIELERKVPCDFQLKPPDGVINQAFCHVQPEQFCEAFSSMHMEIAPEQILKLKETAPEDIVQYHMSLGMYVRNTYGLWQDNEFTKFFRSNGIEHPDMMSHIFLLGFIGYLKNEPVDMATMSREMLGKWMPPPPPPSDK